jgi:hypothetical protein|tara:strand:- start:170 stop:496 length:327 start_codon:yes stop_codon:yes gene_type:complete
LPIPTTVAQAGDRLFDYVHFDAFYYQGYLLNDLFTIDAILARDLPIRRQSISDICNTYDVIGNEACFNDDLIRQTTPIVSNGGRMYVVREIRAVWDTKYRRQPCAPDK